MSPLSPALQALHEMLHDDTAQPHEVAWHIDAFLGEALHDRLLDDATARRLMHICMSLPLERPSELHSSMLAHAVRMVELHPSFRLTDFMRLWDVTNLRPVDGTWRKNASGQRLSPLTERLAQSVMRYRLLHPDDPFDEATAAFADRMAAGMGLLTPRPMVAVKVYDADAGEAGAASVKLVGPDGDEVYADADLFTVEPHEIAGRMYDVLCRRLDETGRLYVDTVALSTRPVADVFGQATGRVDRYDPLHDHYHIYDPLSRHFVAASPRLVPPVGSYVRFSPIVPARDRFKSAIIIALVSQGDGRRAFGPVPARVTAVNRDKGWFAYTTLDGRHGYASLDLAPATLATGQSVGLVTYLRRGRDLQKRPHVAEVICHN